VNAVGVVLRAGVRRHRVQGIVIGLATAVAVTASVLGAALLVVSSGPFDSAFADQNGAHLTAAFDPELVGPGDLASLRPDGVTAAAGPYLTVTVTPQINGRDDYPLTLAGRDTPDAAVDRLTLVKGRWADGVGEVVLSDAHWFDPVGMTLVLPDRPASPTLTVVGTARSAGQSADGWITTDQAAALTGPGLPGGYQMLYRLAAADTPAAIDAARTAVAGRLPAESMLGAQSWLDVKQASERETAVYLPFLAAFGVLGLIMSVLIVGNVVAAAVSTGTRRIGVLKAVGFTPGQVMRVYMGQALVPAAAGTAVGVLAGFLLAAPILAEAGTVYGSGVPAVPLWIGAVAAAGVLTLVTVTAWAASGRAGRLRTVEALAAGHTPPAGRGQAVSRLVARLPLPLPVTYGLARPLSRPGRALAMIAAVAFGATAVTFATGLGTSLNHILAARQHKAADVTVTGIAAGGGSPPNLPADASAITTAIRTQPGTQAYYSVSSIPAVAAGVSGSTILTAFTGSAVGGGYAMIDGEWFDAPGEAVAATGFLTATGTALGDTVTLSADNQQITLQIVGEVFDSTNDGMSVFTDAGNLPSGAPVSSIKISVTADTDAAVYAEELEDTIRPLGATTAGSATAGSDMAVVLGGLTAALTLMLIVVAGLGVLNTVLLDTRERARDIGIHKAIGMTPRQTVTHILSGVVLNGLLGGTIGATAGILLHRWVVPAMGASAGLRLPAVALDVYSAALVALLGLSGLVIALASAVWPAVWTARSRTATALRTE
jgi:putative ABC transport system permease protein